MISANNVTLRLGKKALFEEVNIKDFINQDRIFYINQDKRIVIKLY